MAQIWGKITFCCLHASKSFLAILGTSYTKYMYVSLAMAKCGHSKSWWNVSLSDLHVKPPKIRSSISQWKKINIAHQMAKNVFTHWHFCWKISFWCWISFWWQLYSWYYKTKVPETFKMFNLTIYFNLLGKRKIVRYIAKMRFPTYHQKVSLSHKVQAESQTNSTK